MNIQELIYKDSKLYDLEGKEVTALPVGLPQTITGFPGEENLDKRAVDDILEKVVEQYAITNANAYVRGIVDKRSFKDPPYVPIQFYKMA
jgi:hypothetical protein